MYLKNMNVVWVDTKETRYAYFLAIMLIGKFTVCWEYVQFVTSL
jgi:hypothetical protein